MGGGPKRVGGWPGGPVVCRQWVGAFIQREMLIVCLKLKSITSNFSFLENCQNLKVNPH